ncbi:MAG: glycosyltransferase, partial [Pseudomonadota bacterium]
LGRAILAPDQANIREILEDGRSGVLFEHDNDAAFAAALARLVDDADLRATLGGGARARIEEGGFLWARNAERVLAAGARLAAARGGLPREPAAESARK